MRLLRTAFRGWLIVTLTAANVRFIAGGVYPEAFVTGCAISWTWWANAHRAAHDNVRGAQAAYAIGAGVGTVCGMLLGRLL